MVAGEGEFLTDRIYLSQVTKAIPYKPMNGEKMHFIWSHDESEDFTLNSAFKGIRKEGGSEAFVYMAFNGSGNLICREESAEYPATKTSFSYNRTAYIQPCSTYQSHSEY